MSLAQAIEAWARIVGRDDVLDADGIHATMPRCTTGAMRAVPALIRLRRASEDEPDDAVVTQRLIPILRIAAEYSIAIHPISTGRNWGYGTWLPPTDSCAVLDLSALRRIRDFDPHGGNVVVEPGVTQQQLAQFLNQGNHPFLVPVTGAGPACSVLANALERGYGITPTMDHFAAVLSLEAVLADGTRYRSPLDELSSPRPAAGFKWGVGSYLDGLFTQSAMGIVTALRIALARRPEVVKVFMAPIAAGTPIEEIVRTVHEIKCALPGLVGGINLLNAHRALAMVAPYPWDARAPEGVISAQSLAAMRRRYGIGDWTLFGTLYGTRRTTAAARREIRRLCRPSGIRVGFLSTGELRFMEAVALKLPFNRIRHAVSRRLRMLRMAAELAEGQPNETALPLAYWRNQKSPPSDAPLDPARDDCGLIWYAPLVPMRGDMVREFVEFLTQTMTRYGMEPLITLTTVSEQCFDASIPILFDKVDAAAAAKARACFDELMRRGVEKGFVPYRLPIDAMPAMQDYTLSHSLLSQRLKRAIDPADILSPGKYCGPYGPRQP